MSVYALVLSPRLHSFSATMTSLVPKQASLTHTYAGRHVQTQVQYTSIRWSRRLLSQHALSLKFRCAQSAAAHRGSNAARRSYHGTMGHCGNTAPHTVAHRSAHRGSTALHRGNTAPHTAVPTPRVFVLRTWSCAHMLSIGATVHSKMSSER